jgi:hypothetical protein
MAIGCELHYGAAPAESGKRSTRAADHEPLRHPLSGPFKFCGKIGYAEESPP